MEYTTIKVSKRVVERIAYLKAIHKKYKTYDDVLMDKLDINKDDTSDKKREYGCHECGNPVFKNQKRCDKCGAPFIWD